MDEAKNKSWRTNRLVAFLTAILLMIAFLSFPTEVDAKSVIQFSAENNGATQGQTFFGHYGGALDYTWSGTADGGSMANGKYVNAVNRYLDSGRNFTFDSSYYVEFHVGAYAGSYNIYVGDSNRNWYKIGTVNLSSYTFGSIVVYGNNLPKRDNIRYYRVEKATASAKAVDHIRVYIGRTDNDPPTYSSYSITNISEAGYTVNVYGVSDAVTGVNRVQIPTWTSHNGQDDIVWYPATHHGGGHWSYTVRRSNHNNEYGTYNSHIYMWDNYDNSTSISTTTVVPDLTNPNISLSQTPSGWTNGNVTINYSASDNAGGSGYKHTRLPNGNYNSNASSSYVVSSNGSYTFTAYDQFDNTASQTINVSNIDKTAPTLTLSANVTGYTSGNVVITATGDDGLSGVKRIKLPNGSWVSTTGSTTYTATSNETLSFTVEDNAGNQTTKSITVGNIDKTAPDATITPSTTGWTNGNVTLSVSATDNLSGVSTIEKPDGSIVNGASTTYVASGNGTYSFKIKDAVGNTATKSITVSNIDKGVPGLTLTANPTAWTNGSVTISAIASDGLSGVKQIILPNNSSVNGSTATYTTSSNNSLTFKAVDNAGNITTKTITVSNIDVSAPTANITASPSTWTSGNVTLSITAEDTGSGVSYIKKPDGSIVNGSTASYVATENNTFNFEVYDSAGNRTVKSYTVSNIDRNSPGLTITADKTNWTNGSVILTATATDVGSGVATIEKPDGSRVSGQSTTFTATQNGTFTFKVTDGVGNVTTKSITVSNIDKVVDGGTITQSPTGWVNTSVTISVTGTDSQSGIAKIKLPNGTFVNGSSATYSVSSNANYSFEIHDNVGNVLVKSITISNIDKTAPVSTATKTPSVWTNGAVQITITSTDTQSGVKQIKKPDGTVVSSNTTTYTVVDNGSYVFEIVDNAGNKEVKTVAVDNIDRTAPNASLTLSNPLMTIEPVDIIVNATDSQSGVKQITLPDGRVVAGSSARFTVVQNGLYNFIIEDVAGNRATETIEVGNILQIDTKSGINRIEYKLSGATTQDWTTYVNPFYISNEGITTIYARSIDNAGNYSEVATSMVRVDKTKPANSSVKIKLR